MKPKKNFGNISGGRKRERDREKKRENEQDNGDVSVAKN